MFNTLKVFEVSFFKQLFDSLGTLLQSAFEIVVLVVTFAFIWGLVALPVLLLYVIVLFVIEHIFKKQTDFLKYFQVVTIVSGIATLFLVGFVL